MKNPIALVTSLDPDAENVWLAEIARLLPDERLLPFQRMDALERQNADIAIVANPDPAHVAALPGLVWVHSLWAGVEKLVSELGPSAPPIVRLVDPELARVMAEAVLAWTYYLHRDMPAYRKQQSERVWKPRPYRHPSQLTVGILGLGALGTAAADRLNGAGFEVIGWSRSAKSFQRIRCLHGEPGLDELVGTADIVVCLLPLTKDTRGLLHAERLGRMKAGASLINFARGPIVVIEDLLRALDTGHISHAVLDVFDQEPLPGHSSLWEHPGLTILPHISAPTDRASAARIVAANVRAYRSTGALPHTIDAEQGY
ncbi:glyoxylate/hydroxypyruvate reductase A [Ensifer sp. ENS12]|uniref:2-hydroxyacid dehydrogenase n=1 Tax=Ensifer sp. ENS12 TaxID=2854774 RepID=UPI001C465A67|nr:glyoxylate/hydroxypyruvate reductase A [Ensifer sp. ENS12]MBV7519059.1 glyoxylate/hydroxypyruvate reductase A [Ensifer sp. ENS12]